MYKAERESASLIVLRTALVFQQHHPMAPLISAILIPLVQMAYDPFNVRRGFKIDAMRTLKGSYATFVRGG